MSGTTFTLQAVSVNDKTEKKGNLTYLSWPYAWGKTREAFPAAAYRVRHDAEGRNYFTDGRTAWVEIEFTADGERWLEETLPVMDSRNNSLPAERVTSYDVNKTIKRALVKAIAMETGLGLYIYAGEDLPDGAEAAEPKPAPKAARTSTSKPHAALAEWSCKDCGKAVTDVPGREGGTVTAAMVANSTQRRFGRVLCAECAKKAEEAAKNENADNGTVPA